MESGQTPRVPVYCDSPMAIKAVEIFLKHSEEYSDETRQLISQVWISVEVAGIYFCVNPRKNLKRSMK